MNNFYLLHNKNQQNIDNLMPPNIETQKKLYKKINK